MYRLLAPVIEYFRDLARTTIGAWRQFFFTPADPTTIGLIRIAVGSLMIWNLATLGPDLREYLGSDGWIGPEAVRHYLAEHAPTAWSFWFYVPDAWLVPVWIVCLVVLALFTAGVASPLTAVLAWAIAISTARRAPVTLFGFDQMLATWALYLAVCGASGQALSVDRALALRARGKSRSGRSYLGTTNEQEYPEPTVSANLCLRLLQLHLLLVYGSAGLSKLIGREWWNGTALEVILLTPEFRQLDPSWFLARPGLLQLATHAGLFLEITYPVLIWIRPLRPLLLTCVVLMHLGIDAMLGLTEFSLAMVAANLAFLPGRRPNLVAAPPEDSVEKFRAESRKGLRRVRQIGP